MFGISTLPPAYLDLLLALAEHVPVHMFLLSPSRQYWGDLPGQRERLRDYRLLTEHGVPPQEEVTEDFMSFIDYFHLFFCIAVVFKDIYVR